MAGHSNGLLDSGAGVSNSANCAIPNVRGCLDAPHHCWHSHRSRYNEGLIGARSHSPHTTCVLYICVYVCISISNFMDECGARLLMIQ